MSFGLTWRRVHQRTLAIDRIWTSSLNKSTVQHNLFGRSYTDLSSDTSNKINKDAPLRVAIVGSGPGGFYTAGRLFKNLSEEELLVDMFEKFPVPHGLVRYGVAPDHPEVKHVINKFDEVASHVGFKFFGNVDVGTNLSVDILRSHYDAVVMAYGSTGDKNLSVAGESLEGVVSARSFVNWYNGSPDYFGLAAPDLTSSDTAVIFGQGNVALDMARILLTPIDTLAKTDITSESLEVLSRSTIKHVHVIGRRGPLQVSFTAKELREIFALPETKIHLDQALLTSQMELNKDSISKDRPLSRLMGLLVKGYKENQTKFQNLPEKSCHFSFLRSPLEFVGCGKLKSVLLGVNALEGELPRAILTDIRESIDCGLALRAIGYKSMQLANLPFDPKSGKMPNQFGRVIGKPTEPSGLYVSGWLKTGPVGVIATTLIHAHETADIISSDFKQGVLASGRPGLSLDSLKKFGLRPTTYADWKKLEQHEFEVGARSNKPREKVTSIDEMLKIISP